MYQCIIIIVIAATLGYLFTIPQLLKLEIPSNCCFEEILKEFNFLKQLYLILVFH